jgi:hypothetical protein
MVRGSKIKGLVLLWLFFGTAVVYAAPTVNDHTEDVIVFAESSGLYIYPCYRPEKDNNTGLFKSQLASISEEFNKPPVKYGESSATAIGVKSLPPAPGTLLMVLVGFFCVSLVKDRRIWLAALSGLLWAGQAGISLLPQLAINVSGIVLSENQSSSHYFACLCEPKQPNRLRSDIEGTCYVGLLRHLAGIPNAETSSMPRIKVRHKLKQASGRMLLSFCRRTCCSGKSVQSFCCPSTLALLQNNSRNTFRYYKKSPHFAITAISSCLNQAIHCRIPVSGQLNYFTTAFINASLARGPPDCN